MTSGLLAKAMQLREQGMSSAALLLEKLRSEGRSLAGAESCTGGLISARLTAVPGSSDVFRGTVVSYTCEVKHTVLYVPNEMIKEYGVVSEQVADAMVKGASFLTGADTAYSVTGVAGPGGGTEATPVGTVCFGFLEKGKVRTVTKHFEGDRSQVRNQASDFVIAELLRR